MGKKCDCKVCQDRKRFVKILNKLDEDEKKFLEDMYEAHMEDSECAAWFKCKYQELKRKYERLDQI